MLFQIFKSLTEIQWLALATFLFPHIGGNLHSHGCHVCHFCIIERLHLADARHRHRGVAAGPEELDEAVPRLDLLHPVLGVARPLVQPQGQHKVRGVEGVGPGGDTQPGGEDQDSCEEEDQPLGGVGQGVLHHPVGVGQALTLVAHAVVDETEDNVDQHGEEHTHNLHPGLQQCGDV